MTAWENKIRAIKTDWTETKQNFKGLVWDFEIYKQYSSGTTGKGKYESANQATKAAQQTQTIHCHHHGSSGHQI
jgi:hypothetical protein